MRISSPYLVTIMLAAFSPGLISQKTLAKKITEAEIKMAINSQRDADACDGLDQIHIDHLEYFDFRGDGSEEAIVVASTCMTGTAGPDIHAVYTRDAQARLVELPLEDSRGDLPIPNWKRGDIPIFGNANYGLSVENGLLVARWSDSSDREAPVVAWFQWNGKRFVLDHLKVEGPFQTSYDCAKATRELDRAICYSSSVAALDFKLAQVYATALRRRSHENRPMLQASQREWLARREKECTIYKWWVDCLTDMYNKRIAELKQQ